jgi:hypothetical protein
MEANMKITIDKPKKPDFKCGDYFICKPTQALGQIIQIDKNEYTIINVETGYKAINCTAFYITSLLEEYIRKKGEIIKVKVKEIIVEEQ